MTLVQSISINLWQLTSNIMKAASGVDKLLLFTAELNSENRYLGFCFLSKYGVKTVPCDSYSSCYLLSFHFLSIRALYSQATSGAQREKSRGGEIFPCKRFNACSNALCKSHKIRNTKVTIAGYHALNQSNRSEFPR